MLPLAAPTSYTIQMRNLHCVATTLMIDADAPRIFMFTQQVALVWYIRDECLPWIASLHQLESSLIQQCDITSCRLFWESCDVSI